jgi:hypothetical protein
MALFYGQPCPLCGLNMTDDDRRFATVASRLSQVRQGIPVHGSLAGCLTSRRRGEANLAAIGAKARP